MAETTKRGTLRLPDAVRQYAARLGKAGLDYRQIRIARTETTAMLADEQTEIAENSDICSGEMDFVLDRGRDHWNCNCEHYAEQNPWKVDDPDRPQIPVHPNCMCEWRPRLKTDEEILAAFKEEMAQDLEAIEGTQEQRDLLERWTCPKCGYTAVENGKLRNAKHCPVCGASMEHEGAPDNDKPPDYQPVMQEIRDEFQDMANQVFYAAPKEQQEAIKGYTGSGFVELNKWLYGDDSYMSTETENMAKNLDKIIEKYKLDKDIIAYRGTEASFYVDWETGKSYQLPAFTSTSIDSKNEIVTGERDMNIEMRIRKGTTGMYLGDLSWHKSEEEFLLGRNLKYTVIEKTTNSMILEVSNG
jgi:rubrerythrin